jgi:protein-tyrosine phosphatase
MRIMTVCLGNICRSPAAEAVLVRRLEAAGLADVTVTSAGTADYHVGSRPHHHSVAEGEGRGYVFDSVALQFVADHFDDVDLILAMDRSNEADLLALARTPQDRAKVVRLGAFAADTTGEVLDVPDPWGLPRDAYAGMFDQIEDAVDGLVQAIQDGTLDQVLAARRSRADVPGSRTPTA